MYSSFKTHGKDNGVTAIGDDGINADRHLEALENTMLGNTRRAL